MAKRIGEIMVLMGAMKSEQIEPILAVQRAGDKRLFGEIALSLGFIEDNALRRYAAENKVSSYTLDEVFFGHLTVAGGPLVKERLDIQPCGRTIGSKLGFSTASYCSRDIPPEPTGEAQRGNIMKKLLMIPLACLFLSPSVLAQDLLQLAQTGTPEQVQAAIAEGAKVDDLDKFGATPLMYAAMHNPNAEVITTLLRAGAEINHPNNEGWTPLMDAALHNQNAEVITTLLKAGAKIDDRSKDGWTPLLAGALNPNTKVISALLDAGAKIDDRGPDGRTALIMASGSNDSEVITTLLKAGANAKLKDNHGKTAFDHAALNEKLKGTDAFEALRRAAGE